MLKRGRNSGGSMMDCKYNLNGNLKLWLNKSNYLLGELLQLDARKLTQLKILIVLSLLNDSQEVAFNTSNILINCVLFFQENPPYQLNFLTYVSSGLVLTHMKSILHGLVHIVYSAQQTWWFKIHLFSKHKNLTQFLGQEVYGSWPNWIQIST